MTRNSFRSLLVIAAAIVFTSCSETPSNNTPTLESSNPEASFERTLEVLPDSAFKQQLTPVSPPATMAPGSRVDLTVRVKNTSDTTWPVRGRVGDGYYQVNLGDRWIDAENKDVKVDERAFLPRAMKPGEEAELPFILIAPPRVGDYTVEFDMVQEGVAWFSQKGATPTRLTIKVQ